MILGQDIFDKLNFFSGSFIDYLSVFKTRREQLQNKVNKIKVTISISIGWVTTAELPEREKKKIF
jgi:hypothetical protein